MIFDDITTGASQDIKQATAIARAMVTKYGMSARLGLVSYGNDSDEVFIGRDWGHTKSYSESVAADIDAEVAGLLRNATKSKRNHRPAYLRAGKVRKRADYKRKAES